MKSKFKAKFKLDTVSSTCLIVGLIFLHWGQTWHYLLGNTFRLASLGMGLLLVVLGSWVMGRKRIKQSPLFMALSGGYFVLLALLSYARGNMVWQDPLQLVFIGVCILLFWSGFILGNGADRMRQAPRTKAMVLEFVGVLAVVGLWSLLQYVKSADFQTAARTFGDDKDTALNPVGVAYSTMCLAIVFSSIGVSECSIWRKLLWFGLAILASFVSISTGSRGAIMWGAVALIYMGLLCRNGRLWTSYPRKKIKRKSSGIVLQTVIVGLVLVTVLLWARDAEVISSNRIEMISSRFGAIIDMLSGSGDDVSASARVDIWNYYLATWDQWIVLGKAEQAGYPHNQWLEIFVKFGILGIPLFAMSIFVLTKVIGTLFMPKANSDLNLKLISSLLVFAYLQSLTSLSLQMNRVLWLGFGYILGAMNAERHLQGPQKSSPRPKSRPRPRRWMEREDSSGSNIKESSNFQKSPVSYQHGRTI